MKTKTIDVMAEAKKKGEEKKPNYTRNYIGRRLSLGV